MNMQGMKLISPAVQHTSFLCVRRLRLIGDHNGLLRSFLATVFSTHLLITLLIHLPLGRGNKRIIVAVPIVLGVALVVHHRELVIDVVQHADVDENRDAVADDDSVEFVHRDADAHALADE